MDNYVDLMFHDAVADLQRADRVYDKYKKFYPHRTLDTLGENEIGFIAARESAYIATVNPDGWPYIQHRGGPAGFMRAIGGNRLACADYRGNQQYISMGNLAVSDRVSLFFMDYMNAARLKVQGHASLRDAADVDPAIVAQLGADGLPMERVLIIDVVALDWNCPKYIPQLYPADIVRQVAAQQMGKLQAENATLRAELAALKAR